MMVAINEIDGMDRNQEKLPLISVVVPIYNVEKYLPLALQSFSGQTYENIEFILVDDASSDYSLEIATAFAQNDRRFRIAKRSQNGGLSCARNTGIDLSTGEYIVFWDGDDTVAPETIEECVNLLQTYDADVCCYTFIKRGPESEEYEHGKGSFSVLDSSTALKRWFHDDGIVTGAVTKVIKRTLLTENGIRFVEGEANEDVLYTAQILAAAQKIVISGRSLYYYLQREGSLSRSYAEVDLEIVFRHCDQLGDFVRKSYPELIDDYLYYRAKSIWGAIADPLSRKRSNLKKSQMLELALEDIEVNIGAYKLLLRHTSKIGFIRLWLMRHKLYWVCFK